MADNRQAQVYFDDVSEGFQLPQRVFGPIESTDVVRFCAAVESASTLHTSQKWCLAQGYKDVLINGPLKQAMLITWMDSWAGDAGVLRKLGCQHRAMDYHNDTLTAGGIVTRAYEQDGLGYVDCDIAITNQRGEVSCPGTATVVLPRRGGEATPIDYAAPDGYDALVEKLASGAEYIIERDPSRTPTHHVGEATLAMIGRAGDKFTPPEPLDRASVRKFGDGTFELKPVYRDAAAASASRYGSLCAPPSYILRPPWDDRGMRGEAAIPHVPVDNVTRLVNGGNEAEWFKPAKLGDTVSQHAYVADVVERTGRSGTMAIIIAETVYTNQRGEMIARSRQSTIRLP